MSNFTSKNAMHNTNLMDFLNGLVDHVNAADGTRVLDNPTVVIGSASKAKVKNSAFSIMKDGVITVVDSAETEFTATDHDIPAEAAKIQEAIFVEYLDGTTLKLEMGEIADDDEAVAPETPDGGIKIGEIKVKVDAGTDDFDASTDLLDAAHLTTTFTTKIDVAPKISFS